MSFLKPRDSPKLIWLVGGISSEMVKDIILINPENYLYDTLLHAVDLKETVANKHQQ